MSDVMTERYEDYDEWIDDLYPETQIGYLTFRASDILFELDPIAYRVGYSDYQDFMEEDND